MLSAQNSLDTDDFLTTEEIKKLKTRITKMKTKIMNIEKIRRRLVNKYESGQTTMTRKEYEICCAGKY